MRTLFFYSILTVLNIIKIERSNCETDFDLNLLDKNWINPQIGGSPGNPGLKIQLTNNGLDYISQVAGDLLNDQMPSSIPDYRKEIKNGFVEATGLKLYDFSPLNFRYSVDSPSTVNWASGGGRVSVHGDWFSTKRFVKFLFGGFSKSFSGSFEMVVTDLDVKIATDFLKSDGNLPRLTAVKCSANFGNLDLSIKGGFWGFLLNLFNGKVEKWLQPKLEAELCATARIFLENDMNAKLSTFPTKVNLSEDFTLDYGLVSDPIMTKDTVVSEHKGEISYKGTGGTEFEPHPLSKSRKSHDFMITIWLSDFLLNSLLSHAHKHEITIYGISKETFPPAENFLKTTCKDKSLCIGSLFKKIGELYPDSESFLVVESFDEPTAILTEDGKAVLQGLGRIRLLVQSEDNNISSKNATEVIIIDFNIHADLSIIVKQPDEMLAGKVKINQILWTLSESKIDGGISFQLDLQELVDITTPLLEELANERLGRGIPIPIIKGVKLEDLDLQILNRTAELRANMKYTGNYDLSKVLE